MAKYTERKPNLGIIVISLLSAACVGFCISTAVLKFENAQLKEKISKLYEEKYESEETTEEQSSETKESIEHGKYPVIKGATLNTRDMTRLLTDENDIPVLYSNDGTRISKLGVDVSSHQGQIDWQAAAADGIEFAFIRAGYRGYETGRISEDSCFKQNAEEAYSAGIEIGLYFYSQALTPKEAREEAEFVISRLDEINANVTLPIVFDWELPEGENVRTEHLSGEEQTLCCKAFCNAIREAGYNAAYYSSVSTAIFSYDLAELCDETLWLAQYTETPDFPYKYDIWQFSCYGIVEGFDTYTDLNLMFID